MTDEQLENEIRALVAKVTKVPAEKISLNANLFTDLGIDSLLGVEIFAILDKKYGIDVPEDKLSKISTINDIVSLVKDLLPDKN